MRYNQAVTKGDQTAIEEKHSSLAPTFLSYHSLQSKGRKLAKVEDYSGLHRTVAHKNGIRM